MCGHFRANLKFTSVHATGEELHVLRHMYSGAHKLLQAPDQYALPLGASECLIP